MTAAQLGDPEGLALVAAIHERKRKADMTTTDQLAAIEARAAADEAEYSSTPGDQTIRDRRALLALVREQAAKLEEATVLIDELADPEACWLDHHGGCQAHGYLDLKPGETCPQHDAKGFRAALTATEGA